MSALIDHILGYIQASAPLCVSIHPFLLLLLLLLLLFFFFFYFSFFFFCSFSFPFYLFILFSTVCEGSGPVIHLAILMLLFLPFFIRLSNSATQQQIAEWLKRFERG